MIGLAGTGAVAAAVPTRAGGGKPGVVGGAFHVDPSHPFRFQGRLPDKRRTPVRLLSHEPSLGELRNWAGLDVAHGTIYPKAFRLRAVGRKIELWVALNLEYQPGDCRNGPHTVVTDAQAQALVRAFDDVIYPRESAVFSVPPDRDGSAARVRPPAFHPAGPGDRIVVLIDNIRDGSFFDLHNAHDFGEVLGVYTPALEQLFDRNMLTVDAVDWSHRTGSDPPHEPATGDPCADAPADPHLIEGTTAHEYQHLLEHHEDPDEVDWLDEGLAEWARSLTGYADPARPVTEIGYDRHTQCFLGNVPELAGGPENSLTVWGDGGDPNCDYGAVYSFMEYLHDRFGTKLMTALHRGDANGLEGLQEALGRRGEAQETVHDWAASLAFGAINWDSAYAYARAGAAPNGADYVRLRDATGGYLRVKDARSLSFDGASSIPGKPVEWVVDTSPPNGGAPALYSGAGNNLDRTLVRALAVPAVGAELAFEAQWNVEEDATGGWDFTFVQVSTDGGASYRSIACTSSGSNASPHARPVMHANLPGYTAYSAGWRHERCDLMAFAGRSILLAFRHLTDGSVAGDPDDPAATIPPGFWLRNVTLAAAPVADGASLSGWLSPSQARPTPVHGFTVQLVAYSSRGQRKGEPARLRLDGNHDVELGGKRLKRLLGNHGDVVGAIVMYDEPTEQVRDYAPYRLTVNDVLQPGG